MHSKVVFDLALLFSFGLLHVSCFVIMIIAVEILRRYFVFLFIPLLRKWTMTGDTCSPTSIPLHADATESLTAKIHLCFLTKLRHTALSLYMFVLSRHCITPFDNCWTTSRSVENCTLPSPYTYILQISIWTSCTVVTVMCCRYISVILTIPSGTLSNLTSL